VTDPPDRPALAAAIIARIDEVLDESRCLTTRHRALLDELDVLLADLEQLLSASAHH
jgi:hypothetical protein